MVAPCGCGFGFAGVTGSVVATGDNEHEDNGESCDYGKRFHSSVGSGSTASGRVSGAGGSASCSHKTKILSVRIQPVSKPESVNSFVSSSCVMRILPSRELNFLNRWN